MENTAAFKVDASRGGSNSTVSRQWLSRPADQKYLDLAALEVAVTARRQISTEFRAETKDIEFIAPQNPTRIEQTHELTIGVGGKELAPTHWTFGQLSGLAKAPASYLRTLPSQIVADAMTYGMRYARGESNEIKLFGIGDSAAAATGADYGRIWDSEVVAAVRQVAGTGRGEQRWKIPGMIDWKTSTYDPEHPVTLDTTTLYASDRDVFIFLVDDRHPIEVGKLAGGEPDYMFRGFYISNSEVGAGALKLAAFYLRGVCMNRTLWGVEQFEEITMRHSKYAPARFIEQARPALETFATGTGTKLIEGVAKAKAAILAADEAEALAFLGRNDFSRKLSMAVVEAGEREEGHKPRTAWDICNAITAVARGVPNMDDRINLERAAGRILDKVA